jgi:hypothetical protein
MQIYNSNLMELLFRMIPLYDTLIYMNYIYIYIYIDNVYIDNVYEKNTQGSIACVKY